MAVQCAKGNQKLQAYKKCFQELDKNNDGHITREEMVAMLREENCRLTDETIEGIFDFFEGRNGDKRITFEEFCAGLDKIFEELRRELYGIFNDLDKDKSGFLDRGELTTLLQQCEQKYSGEEIDIILKEADKNGDGKISFDEFMAALL